MTEQKPVYETQPIISADLGMEIARQLHQAVLEIVAGGMDALYQSEICYDAAQRMDQYRLEEIQQALQEWAERLHGFNNALQKLQYFTDLMEQ